MRFNHRVSAAVSSSCAFALLAIGLSPGIALAQVVPQGQVSLPAERVTGVLLAGGAPIKGATVYAITSTDSAGMCGDTDADDRGRFTLIIESRAPNCVREHRTDPALNYVFVMAGQNLGSVAEGNASLDDPELLGGTRRLNLSWEPIPGFNPTSDGPRPGELVVARYWGQLILANRPAPRGTRIDVALAGSATAARVASYARCALGAVVDDRGDYWIDLLLSSPCVRDVQTSPALTFLFMVNGERVGTANEAFAVRSDHRTLGLPHHMNLQGISHP